MCSINCHLKVLLIVLKGAEPCGKAHDLPKFIVLNTKFIMFDRKSRFQYKNARRLGCHSAAADRGGGAAHRVSETRPRSRPTCGKQIQKRAVVRLDRLATKEMRAMVTDISWRGGGMHTQARRARPW